MTEVMNISIALNMTENNELQDAIKVITRYTCDNCQATQFTSCDYCIRRIRSHWGDHYVYKEEKIKPYPSGIHKKG